MARTIDVTPCQCRAARGLLHWTQHELAERADVSRSTVRDFENGRHELHQASAKRIIEALERAGVVLIGAGKIGRGVRLRTRPDPQAEKQALTHFRGRSRARKP